VTCLWLLFSFKGRISRYDYIVRFLLPLLLVEGIVAVLVPPLLFNAVMVPIFLITTWPSLAVGAKRCHDRGRSGWFQLLLLVPILGPLWLFIELVFLPSIERAGQVSP
jgi:uncharacterized membrane protein YhaH (DUF805 family)